VVMPVEALLRYDEISYEFTFTGEWEDSLDRRAEELNASGGEDSEDLRGAYGWEIGGCVVRAICNASGRPFEEVYARVAELCASGEGGEHPDQGVCPDTVADFIEELGFVEVEPVGCWNDLSRERAIILSVRFPGTDEFADSEKRHMTAVINGALLDCLDCRGWEIVRRFEREAW
jgi:hypothetical protein